MNFFTLVALWIFWLFVLAVFLRFVFGGVIDCLKNGKRAPISSWIGMAFFVILIGVVIAIAR